MTRFNLKISVDDFLDLLSKQRARYSGKLDNAVELSDYNQAKVLINKLEELKIVLDSNPVIGSEVLLTIDIEQQEVPTPSLPRGML